MAASVRAGDVLAGRYRMVDLLVEADGGSMWNAHDRVLHRPVAIHLLPTDDPRADALLEAARRAAPLNDRRNLRVLDCNRTDRFTYVVNEWGTGTSLDVALEAGAVIAPGRAAWLVAQVADTVAASHAGGTTHGRLVPENVMVDENGEVRIIGFGVEAALHQLPPDDVEGDVHALISLLYAALTGRWPGRIPSRVKDARREQGRVVRPRRVRAGIPRQLDRICDDGLAEPGTERHGGDALGLGAVGLGAVGLGSVLGQRAPQTITTAAELRDALEEYLEEFEPELCDSATLHGHGVPGAGQHRPAPEGLAPVLRPWTPPSGDDASTDGAAPHDEDAGAAGPQDGAAKDGAAKDGAVQDQAVQDEKGAAASMAGTAAGLPIFDDDSDVDWRSTEAPAEEADEAGRPLFAPEDESRARRERHRHLFGDDRHVTDRGDEHPLRTSSPSVLAAPHGGRRHDDYWPWDSTDPGSMTSSGLIPPVEGAPVPGRNWMRLAWVVGIAALVLLLGVAAMQLMSPGDRDDDPPAARRSASPDVTASGPLEDLSATDLDPQGNPPEEYPEDTPKAVDGDPDTAWGTQTYSQQLGPDGLKTGVGLVIDLGEARNVRQVQVSVQGGETAAQVFVTSDAPDDVADLEPVAATSGEDVLTFTFEAPVEGRYVTVWLTKLPQQQDGFRGQVSEVDVFA